MRRPFDAARSFCDNPGSLMKLSHVLFVLALAAGCGKPSDLAPLRAETTGLVARYQARVTELEKRLAEFKAAPVRDRHGAALRADSEQTIGQMKFALAAAPQRIDAEAKTGSIALTRYATVMREQLRKNDTIATTKLDALEDLEARAASALPPPPPSPMPAAPPPGTPPPALAP